MAKKEKLIHPVRDRTETPRVGALAAGRERVTAKLASWNDLSCLASGLAAFCLAATLSYLVPSSGSMTLPLLAVFLGGAATFLGIRWTMRRQPDPARWKAGLGAVIAALVVLGIGVQVSGGESDSILLTSLLALGTASFLLPSRLLAWCLASIVFAVAVMTWLGFNTEAWPYLTAALFAASALKLQSETAKLRFEAELRLSEEEIARRKQTEKDLKSLKERYELAAQANHDGIMDWDLRNDKVFYSSRWKSMIGHEDDELSDSPEEWYGRVHSEDLEQTRNAVSRHLSGANSCFEAEYRLLHKNGEYRWMRSRGLAARDSDGKPYRLACSQTDIGAQKVAEGRLIHEALHDALTSLPNRTYLLERLTSSMDAARVRPDYVFAILYMDLNDFKQINDRFGHLVGDELLKLVAKRLESCIRPRDVVSRQGGDEFAIILDELGDFDEATQVATRIQRKLERPFNVDGRQIVTGASMGIVYSKDHYERPEEILRDADTAMYRAKVRGGARFEIFDEDMRAQALEAHRLETDLRRACERREFRVYYQPIVSLKTGRIVGVEALLRWMHPVRGLLLPHQFLPAAEETGLILPIGWWALREASRKARQWQARFPQDPPLNLSFNLSGRQFHQTDLVDQIDRALQESKLPHHCLRLEVTEEAVSRNDRSALDRFQQLHERGVGIHLDNFGTGEVSLSHLSRLPFAASKIDRSFISGMSADQEKKRMMGAMVGLLHNLGIEIMVEGVETTAHLDHAEELKCQFGQGFYFCIPLQSKAVESLLEKSRILQFVKELKDGKEATIH